MKNYIYKAIGARSVAHGVECVGNRTFESVVGQLQILKQSQIANHIAESPEEKIARKVKLRNLD
jgi:hypothetical protein